MILSKIKNKLLSFIKNKENRFLKDINGLIHIGANTGQEREIYEKYGLSVIWVEPIPEVFQKLKKNIEVHKRQIAIQALLTDINGKEYEFNIANNGGASSSILNFKDHKKIWPKVNYQEKIKIKSSTLIEIIESNNIDIKNYEALILDTQGSELLILKGAISLLNNFKYVQVEVPDFESYEGCCTLEQMLLFMKENNFYEYNRNKFAQLQKGKGSYYDVTFKNRNK